MRKDFPDRPRLRDERDLVMVGSLVGCVLPLIFRSLGLDPALMSNPFVSAIVDVVGIVIYMGIALALLGG